jgi:DNA helicase-2/ATP-dependent DNA helicase PcrA
MQPPSRTSRAEGIRDFLDHAALASDTDDYKEAAQVTYDHALGEGLEFPVVFMPVSRGLFPHSRGSEEAGSKRSAASATWRSPGRRFLPLTRIKRRVYGDEMLTEPSGFDGIPAGSIDNKSTGPSWLGSPDPSADRYRRRPRNDRATIRAGHITT